MVWFRTGTPREVHPLGMLFSVTFLQVEQGTVLILQFGPGLVSYLTESVKQLYISAISMVPCRITLIVLSSDNVS